MITDIQKERAWKLYLNGYNLRDIARKLTTADKPVSTEMVSKGLSDLITAANVVTEALVAEQLSVELSRLDELYKITWETILGTLMEDFNFNGGGADEDAEVKLFRIKAAQVAATLIDKCLKVSDTKAKLLRLYDVKPAAVKSKYDEDVDYSQLSIEELHAHLITASPAD
jgi:hypothetical protein